MTELSEAQISRAILTAYYDKLQESVESDVIVVGAGPSGMTAAISLAREGLTVTVLEKRLSPGGGIWGGGMAMNEAVIQEEARPVLEEIGVPHRAGQNGLHTVDTIELAAALALKTLQSGAVLFNLVTVEDVCLHQGRVTGVVANRTMIGENAPIDPIMFSANAVIDATGHDAAVLEMLRRRGIIPVSDGRERTGEGPVDAASGEAFVVERTCEVFPGLWISGMSVCAAFGGPRMGPIFGGMLLSGRRAAELILRDLKWKRRRQ
jgi:thiamine thiazole synthase